MILHIRVRQDDHLADAVLLMVSLAVGAVGPELELRRLPSTSAFWRSDLCDLLHELTGSGIPAQDGGA
jgi:hypothetical protein